MQLEIDGN